MENRQTGSTMIAGAILAGAGGITIGLAAIALANLFATLVGAILLATGLVVMFGKAAVWNAIWHVFAAPFRAYARLYRSQWRSTEDGKHESSGN